jgi:hypothetical protein
MSRVLAASTDGALAGAPLAPSVPSAIAVLAVLSASGSS